MPVVQYKFSLFCHAGLLLLAVFLSGRVPDCHAAMAVSRPIPDRLARIVYQEKPESKQKIYIVAQSHPSALTGENAADTLQVQAEIYRIGEWLIENRGIGVLLPEGYFQKETKGASIKTRCGREVVRDGRALPDATLLDRLAATDHFVNAGLLLHDDFGISLRQIEDRGLHANVCLLLGELVQPEPDDNLPAIAAALDYQQKKRSAALLRNIPDALAAGADDQERFRGNALLTVGLAHLKEMVAFLRNGKTVVDPFSRGAERSKGYCCDLAQLKNNYGITILLPPTLAQNKDLRPLITFN